MKASDSGKKDGLRTTAELTDDLELLPPEVRVEGDVPEAIVDAVTEAVENNPNACDEPRLFGADEWDGYGANENACAYFVARYNEQPVVGDGGELSGWLPPYRAREDVDADLLDGLDGYHFEAENNAVTGFYEVA